MKTTEELKNILVGKKNIHQYLAENKAELTTISFSEQLKAHMLLAKLKRSEVLAQTLIYSRYGYEIFEGTKKPTRDKVLQLCLAMRLSLIDAQHLLNSAGVSELYPRKIRDSIIIHCLHNHKSVMECNEILEDKQMDLLE
ncbi:MAG: hypothetical protein RR071_09860 [Lachnospiraceae bacterium]